MRGKTRLKRLKKRAQRALARVRPGGSRTAAPAGAAAPAPPKPDRRDLLKAPIDLAGLGLEIGPSHNPLLPKAEGFRIKTADHLDREGLVAKYATHPNVDVSRIEDVDYVLTAGSIADEIDEKFDYIVGSHLIEHTVCLVSFLQDCERLLADGGVLSLAIPDRRWCFDRFRERTSLGRVVDTYLNPPKVHTPGTLLEFRLNVVRKNGVIAWVPANPGPYTNVHPTDEAGLVETHRKMDEAAAGTYLDVHNWVFTPNHFRLLMSDLYDNGYTRLRETYFHDSVGIEFFVGMALHGDGPGLTRHELLTLADAERSVEDTVTWA